jgi:two-component system alkaline phosphatase synthesis response regulator PhoP
MSDPTPIFSSDDEQIPLNNRVLIFSREQETRLLLGTLLELWGYQTEGFESLETSLPEIESEPPRLILLDSTLPFETHLENIRQIRRNKFLKETPIIVISGFSQPKFRQLSIAVGANDFLVKPLDFDRLENYLKKTCPQHTGKVH